MMCDSQRSSSKQQQPQKTARPIPALRSLHDAQHSTNRSVGPTRHERDPDPAPSDTTGHISPTLVTLPPPPPIPISKPSTPARRQIVTPPTRPDSEPSPPRPVPEARSKKIHSSPDVPPPLAPRRPSGTLVSQSTVKAHRKAALQPHYSAQDADLLNQYVPPSAANANSPYSDRRCKTD